MGAVSSIRENEAQQARLRARLDRMGGPLKPLRRQRERLNGNADDPWGIRSLARGVRVDVKTAGTDAASWAARGVSRALESCGLNARVTNETGSTWEGIHVESRSDEAAVALLVQSAFRTAGFDAGLTIHDRAAAKRVVVHVGSNGLA